MKSFVHILVPLPKDQRKPCWFCDGTGKITYDQPCPRPGCNDGMIEAELTTVDSKYVDEHEGAWFYCPHAPEVLDDTP